MGPKCAALAEIEARLALTPNVVLSHEPSPPAGARARLSASLDGAEFVLVLALGTETSSRTHRAVSPLDALEAIWPAELPPLGPPVVAPNRPALEAACRGEGAAAALAGGSALGPLLPRLTAIRPSRRAPELTQAWARGLEMVSSGQAGSAWRKLKDVLERLERGELAPTWRRLATSSTAAPSRLTSVGDELLAFGSGSLQGLDPRSGRTRWARDLGRADPDAIALDPRGPALVVGERALWAISARDGQVLWKRAAKRPAPHPIVLSRRVIAADADALFALDVQSGAERWSLPLPSPPSGGPVEAGGFVHLPLESKILRVDPRTGKQGPEFGLEDEISGPLVPTARGQLWVPIGGDRIMQIDPERRAIRARFDDLFGLDWPGVMLGERLTALQQNGRRTRVVWLDPDDGRIEKREPATAPLARRTDFSGSLHPSSSRRHLVVRDPSGRMVVQIRASRSIEALATHGARAVLGEKDRAEIVDLAARKVVRRIDLEGTVVELTLSSEVEIATLADGGAYGWPVPGSPIWQAWRQRARLDLAESAMAAGRHSDAQKAAEEALSRSPGLVRARWLRAQALEARNQRSAPDAWLQLALELPSGSAPATDARRALERYGLSVGSFEPSATSTKSTLPIRDGKLVLGEQTFEAKGEALVAAEASGDAVWVWTDQGLHRVDPATARRTSKLRLASRPQLHLLTERVGFSYDGLTLSAIQLDPLRLLGRVEIQGVEGMGHAGDRTWLDLGPRGFVELDPEHGLGVAPR